MSPRVLIVDDEQWGRDTLEALLMPEGHVLAFAAAGDEALASIVATPPDVVLLDVMMPGMDGFEVCRRVRANQAIAEVPIVLVTALDDRGSRIQGIEAGADDFVSKPFDRVELRTRVRTITRLNRYRALVVERQKLADSYQKTLEGWVRALDLRDEETEGHTLRVTEMTVALAEAWGIPPEEREHIRRGALLHDIGKIGVPDRILLKPGKLTDDEWIVMKQHPDFAYRMLVPIEYLQPALDIPHSHHERWDGGGYPRGLKGEEIPLSARLFSVVDTYDALTSKRPYKDAWPPERALQVIRESSGTHFDPAAVACFIAMIEKRMAA
jgi:putative two-component system response regulator